MNRCFFAGQCLIGYRKTKDQKCYRYYGGVATYNEAHDICALEKAQLVKPNNQFWVHISEVIQFYQQVRQRCHTS